MEIKPAPGRRMRDPRTGRVLGPDEIVRVHDHDPFWRRAVSDGDMVRVETEPVKPAKKGKE